MSFRMAGVWVGVGFVAGLAVGGTIEAPNMLAEVKGIFGVPQETELAAIPLTEDELRISNNELEISGSDIANTPSAAAPDSKPQAVNTSLGSGPVALSFDFSGATIQIMADKVEVTSTGASSLKTQTQAVAGEGKACSTNEYSVPQRENIMLSEVAWMGTEESPAAEWMEIKNTGQSEADISGWQVATRDRGVAAVFSAGTKIPPRGLFLMERGNDNTVAGVKADLVYKGPLLNEDEALFIFDESCNLMDEVEAGMKWPAGEASERKPMERDWVTLNWRTAKEVGGTPGADNNVVVVAGAAQMNSAPAVVSQPLTPAGGGEAETGTGTVQISEIQAGTDAGGSDEFIELYNSGSAAADLTGWTIKKKSSTGAESSLVATSRLEGEQIPAGKKFLLVNEGGYAGSVTADATWAISNTIAYTNNAVVLYNAEGAAVEEVSWTDIPKNKSYEKVGGSWQVRENPNPENLQY